MASLFWPKLMEVRGLLERLEPGDLGQAATFIKASLCDGEDEAAPELRAALGVTITEQQRRAWLEIRARVENIVHSLLRVEKFQTSLPKIINPKATPESSPKPPSATNVSGQPRGRPGAPDRQVSRSVPAQNSRIPRA